MSAGENKFQYWGKKLKELPDTLEPLTMLMIRTTDECVYYGRQHKCIKKQIIDTKDINILHAIDTYPALEKFNERRKFILENKVRIKEQVKNTGFFNLASTWLRKFSPFASINDTMVASIFPRGNSTKYITCSGVGRIAALQAVFPSGIKIEIDVVRVPYSLQKRLVAINSLYLYGERFNNLEKYGIFFEEILFTRNKSFTSKLYKRSKYLKSRKRKQKFVPYK